MEEGCWSLMAAAAAIAGELLTTEKFSAHTYPPTNAGGVKGERWGTALYRNWDRRNMIFVSRPV